MSDPVTFIKGDDPALVADALRSVVDEALGGEDRSLALEEYGGPGADESTVPAIVDAARTPPFLSGRRVIVVRDVGQWSSDHVAPILDYLAEPLDSTSLILVAGGGQTSQRLLAAVKKAGRLIDAAAPTGRARQAWVVGRLKSAPVRLDAAAGARLTEHLGEDLGRLPTIIDVLVSTYGEGAQVGVEQLEPFLGGAGSVAPWDLTDAIDAGDTAGALAALTRLTGAGERHPLVVLASLHRHYAAMLRLDGSGITSEQEAAGVLGMAPFPAKKAMLQSRRLGSAGVARAIERIAAADLDLRGLKEWPEGLVVEVLVARLSRLIGPRQPARRR